MKKIFLLLLIYATLGGAILTDAGLFERSVLAANDQNNGDVSDVTKIENIQSYTADQMDANWQNYSNHKTAATLDHPDASVTTEKIANGAITNSKYAAGSITGDKIAAGSTSETVNGARIDTIQQTLNSNAQLMPINITKYGAVGDGSTDALAAFNEAVEALNSDPTVIVSDNLNTDSDADHIANNWTEYDDPGITGTFSVSSSGQTIVVSASTAKGGEAIYRDFAVDVGETTRVNFTYHSQATVGSYSPTLLVQALDNDDALIQTLENETLSNSATNTTYESSAYVIPSGATKLRVYLMSYANVIGDTGTVTYTGFELTQDTDNAKKYTLKFPQNTDGNAVYYFSSTPNLESIKIEADDGVVLSFPTTNAKSFKNVVFESDVSIYSRDRDNTGVQFKNDYSNLIFNALTENDISVGVKKLSLIDDADVSRNIYVRGSSGTISSATLAYDSDTNMYSMANVSDIPNDLNKVVTLEFPFTENNLYSSDFQFTAAETNSIAQIGVTATKDGTNWNFYGIRMDGSTKNMQNVAGVFSLVSSRTVSTLLNNAYKMNTGLIFSARPIGNNKIQIFLNGFYIETITVPFTFTKIGFGMSTVNATGQGLQNTQWGRMVTGECPQNNIGSSLNIAAFGDSITFGEGSISWAEYLPKFLKGQKGITNVTVSNYATSGNKSSDQLSKMQTISLTNFDMVVILIGTNDIQSLIDLDTFKSNVQSMIDLAKSSYRKVVIGIPPMWIDESLTGHGASTSNYEKGAAYRSVVMQLAASNDIYIADTMSEIGRIGADNVLNVLRDNLHPNEFGQILLARCFARSILSALTE